MAQPIGFALLTAAFVCIVLIALSYMATSTYDRSETVLGYVAPAGGLAQVYASRGGTVSRVMVAEGDRIRRGDALVEVSVDSAGTGGPLAARLRAELELRLKELEAQAAIAGTRHAQEEGRLRDRLAGLRQELPQLDARLEGERELLRLAAENRARLEALATAGNATRQELAARRQQELSQANAVRELERQREAREADRRDLEHQLALLPIDRDERLSQLRSARAEVSRSLAELELSQAYVVLAPVDGRVAALQATVGQAAAQDAPLAALVPDGTGIEAHLLVPTRSAGLIAPGQEVRLRVDAFPFQRHGHLAGRVAQVSRAAYRPGQLLGPVDFREPVYRVVVVPAEASVAAYGEEHQVAPGMTLQADIVVDRRSFLDALLDPLRAAGRR